MPGSKSRVGVIIPAAGVGRRMNSKTHKPFLKIRGKEIILWTIESFRLPSIREIILVANDADMAFIKGRFWKKLSSAGVTDAVPGGKRRQDSVSNGLAALSSRSDIVLVHDAVRPFASSKLINKIISETKKYSAAIPGIPPTDTIKKINDSGFACETYVRSGLRCIQTPQGFRRDILEKAYSMNGGQDATDDASLVEALGIPVRIVPGETENFKITTPADIALAKQIIASR